MSLGDRRSDGAGRSREKQRARETRRANEQTSHANLQTCSCARPCPGEPRPGNDARQCDGRSPDSRLAGSCAAFPVSCGPIWRWGRDQWRSMRGRLAAYSCGGSRGIGRTASPHSLFTSARRSTIGSTSTKRIRLSQRKRMSRTDRPRRRAPGLPRGPPERSPHGRTSARRYVIILHSATRRFQSQAARRMRHGLSGTRPRA
jgi:hypothetical protein